MATKLNFVFPEGAHGSSTDKVSRGLIKLTKRLNEMGVGDKNAYGMGGQYGYGEDFENDVFAMSRFNLNYECSEGCPFVLADWEPHVKHTKRGCAVHCTCDFKQRLDAWRAVHQNDHSSTCQMIRRPNFLHKATGFKVEWYKWIGRDMEVENPKRASFDAVLRECLASLKKEQDA